MQATFYPLRAFIMQCHVFHPKLLSISVIGYKKQFLYERSPEDEKLEVYKYVFERMKENKNYLNLRVQITRKRARKAYQQYLAFLANKDKMSNKELGESYTTFMEKYLRYLEYPGGIECVDIFTTYYLKDALKKELPSLSSDKLNDMIMVLTAPSKLSFMEEERVDFLGFCLKYFKLLKKKKRTPSMEHELNKLSTTYFYILNNYRNVRYLDADYFYKKAKEEIKKGKNKLKKESTGLKNKIKNLEKEQKAIYKKYKLSSDLRLHLRIVRIMGEGVDERKSFILKVNYFIEQFCEEIAKRFKLPLPDVKDYSFEEIRKLLLYNKKLSRKILQKRRRVSANVILRTKSGNVNNVWYYGKKAALLLKKTGPKITKIIQGQVASAPVKRFKGKVQVVLDVHKEKFNAGNILVTTMTRPEFVPLMRKAKAILTQEGGVTSHAAIVSRELGIPCIVGIKNLLGNIKDGDYLKVDATKGVVRIVKK